MMSRAFHLKSYIFSLCFALSVLACDKKDATSEHPPVSTGVVAVSATDVAASRDAFHKRHAELATTPEGAIELLVESAILASDPDSAENRGRGRTWIQLLFIPYRDDDSWARKPSNRTFVERLDQMPWIFRSYYKNTSPEAGYALPAGPRSIDVVRSEPRQAGGHTVVIRSSGADQPRPILVKQSDQSGLWYVDSLANLYVDIRPPKKPGEETFH